MMKQYRTARVKGFTIVELAIVISVIGIIASITLVTYSNSQVQARNTKTAAAAEQYKEGLENYLTLKKAYPAVNANGYYCLGVAVSSCTSDVSTYTRSTPLEDALKTVMDAIPVPSGGPGTTTTTGPSLGYIPYRGSTTSPQLDGTNSGFLIYHLEGASSCPVGPVASGAWPSFSSTTPTNGRTYLVGTNVTSCWVPLSRP